MLSVTILMLSVTSRQFVRKGTSRFMLQNVNAFTPVSTTMHHIPNKSKRNMAMITSKYKPNHYYQSSSLLVSTSSSFSSTARSNSNHDKYDNSELESFIQEATSTNDFFASYDKFPTFESVGIKSPILIERVHSILLQKQSNQDSNVVPKPSAVQAASYKAIQSGKDVTIGAETGSGKTLAYLLPIMDDILQSKLKKYNLDQSQTEEEDLNNENYNDNDNDDDDDDDFYENSSKSGLEYDYARAVILVPNKELANQVIRMAVPLAGGEESIIWGPNGERQDNDNMFGSAPPSSSSTTNKKEHEMIRLGFLPGELKIPDDYKPFRTSINNPNQNPPLDIVICTPASLGPWGLNPKNIDVFADIRTLVIDEADMLFDGGYLRQLENTLLGFKRADRLDSSFGVKKTQHVLVAATLPSMGTKSVDAYVQRKFPYATRVTMKGMHNARHYGLGEKTAWVEDDYDEMTPKKLRMQRLVKLLRPTSDNTDDDIDNDLDIPSLAGEKVMVFLNNVNDVDSATNALRRSGIEAVPFHAKLPLKARTQSLERFRKFIAGQTMTQTNDDSDDESNSAVSVLVCTDLAARGLDIPGVTAVVQLQFAGNVVTHLHRMGRCGRAGNQDGRGVIFYGGVESELVEVVRDAEQQQETMVLKGSDIDDCEVDDESSDKQGKVQAAFSRKRGFTRKRKKLRKKASREEQEEDGIFY